MKTYLALLVALLSLASPVTGQPVQPVDLKPFVGPSPVEKVGAEWLVPHGRQVLDGTPFQIDGTILLYGASFGQSAQPGRTNVNNIPVGRSFEELHLLCGTDGTVSNAVPIAILRLHYLDGSNKDLEVRFGDHVRSWYGHWHKEEPPLGDLRTHVAWRGQYSTAARWDQFIRLFHAVLPNPFPEKEVRALSLESTKSKAGLMIMGLSVGPGDAQPLADTVAAPKNPFPDLRPRKGTPTCQEGLVRTREGKPLAGVTVRVLGARKFSTDWQAFKFSHPACGVTSTTDQDGRFRIPNLPDNCLYRLSIGTDGFEPTFYEGADPASDPIEIRLQPKAPQPAHKHLIRVQVIGPEKKPVASVLAEIKGVADRRGTTWGGSTGFPEQIIADEKGNFTLGRNQPFTRVQVKLNAPGYAPTNVWLDLTNATPVVELQVGSTLHGRVTKDGKALADVKIGLTGSERQMEVYAGHFDCETKADGSFAFQHLPPDTTWHLSADLTSFKKHGTFAPQLIRSPGNGETTDLGMIEVVPGITLAGKVQAQAGEPLPPGLKLRVGHSATSDSISEEIDARGSFRFENLPPGEIAIGLEDDRWHFAFVNRSIDQWNTYRLVGMLTKSKEDLLLIIEPGRYQHRGGFNNGQLPQTDWSQNRPISGAEASGPAPIILAGCVVDDATGRPIPCSIVPGRKPPSSTPNPPEPSLVVKMLQPLSKRAEPRAERLYWYTSILEQVTNGQFSIAFPALSSAPILRVQADGYEAVETEPTEVSKTNYVIRLKKAAGPSGVILFPDGRAASNATVIFAAQHEQFSLQDRNLNAYGNREYTTQTGTDGRFAFKPRAHGMTLFVAHETGWAAVSLENQVKALEVKLVPWASVTGTLIDTNSNPAVGIPLRISQQHDWNKGDPFVNLNEEVTTDSKGQFLFTNIPPMALELCRMAAMTGSGPGRVYKPQIKFVAEPGKANDLGKVKMDCPPPASPLEQIKRTLGW